MSRRDRFRAGVSASDGETNHRDGARFPGALSVYQIRQVVRQVAASRTGRLRNQSNKLASRRFARPQVQESERTGRYNLHMIKATEKIWHNGRFINWADATIHVLAHVTSYGSSVFEGLRCYSTRQGPMIFRLREHMRRLHDSAKIYRMEIGHPIDELCAATVELVRANKLESCYIRPLVIRGYGGVGVYAKECPIETYLACWEWGAYLGAEGMEQGVDACVSSWTRLAPNTLPAMSKAGANYMNSQLIRMEAAFNGYAEGIALDAAGYVSEGSGENIFVVRDGKLHTPPLGASVLPGITRDSVIQLAHGLGIPVIETLVPREMLYIADEVFFTGTAAELTPVRSIDRITVGAGKRGPITEKLQAEFFAIVEGHQPDRHGWLTPVGQPVAAR
jgi:branched-chain amino acid aminotransferase